MQTLSGYARRRFGSAFRSDAAKSPASKLGYAAAAIMAALSVDSARLGKKTLAPIAAALDAKRFRNSELAATPPETRTVREPVSVAALRVRVTRSRTTADWNFEISESVSGLQKGSRSDAFRSPCWRTFFRVSIS